MKLSKVGDVGQIRRSIGISTNMRVRPETLLSRQRQSLVRLEWVVTYMHRIPNNIMILTWNKLEMPTARQRSIHITPILPTQSAEVLGIVHQSL